MTGLVRLNALALRAAELELRMCCGSSAWAMHVAARRPYADEAELYAVSEDVWWNLTPNDWHEAFRSHPRIGERAAEAPRSAVAVKWSVSEQAGVKEAPDAIRDALAHANAEYHARFGYIFIVCATGKSAQEILAILRGRLGNDGATELRIAAGEQSKITRLRLEKLLDRLSGP